MKQSEAKDLKPSEQDQAEIRGFIDFDTREEKGWDKGKATES